MCAQCSLLCIPGIGMQDASANMQVTNNAGQSVFCVIHAHVAAGVLINAAMPNWLITLLLVLVLTWLTLKTLQKGRQLHSSEVAAQQEQLSDGSQHGHLDGVDHDTKPESSAAHQSSNTQEKISLAGDGLADSYNTSLEDNDAVLADSTEPDMESGQVFAADNDNDVGQRRPSDLAACIPWKVIKFGQLSCLWAAFLGLQYGKVSFSQCSWQYALLCSAQAVFSLITTCLFIFQAHSLRSADAHELQDRLLHDRKAIVSHHDWPMSKLFRCVIIVLFGGIVAGMLGFGGGMILNPLMLEMGINPLVSSATSSVMVLFSASAATFSFAVSGRLNHQYALVYGSLCAVASTIGVAVISTSVRRSGKGSRIVFILALIIATGALMQALFGGAAAVHDIRTGQHMSFSSLC